MIDETRFYNNIALAELQSSNQELCVGIMEVDKNTAVSQVKKIFERLNWYTGVKNFETIKEAFEKMEKDVSQVILYINADDKVCRREYIKNIFKGNAVYL